MNDATLDVLEIEEEQDEQKLDLSFNPHDGELSNSLSLFMNELGRYPLLTAAQEVELAKRIERGDESAKEQMINSNLRLVVHIARRYVGHSVPLGDLIQEGVIGLNRAAEKFDWRKGFKFSTYATWWIRQACQRAVANQSKTIRIPVHVDERRNKLRRARQQFEIKHGREPSVEELAEAGGMSVQHAQEALEAVEASVSLNARLGDGDAELGDLFADQESIDPELAADDALRSVAVRQALEKLPERERKVIEMRFGFHGEATSLEAIGRELGITRERVRQLEAEAFARLAGELENVVADAAHLADSARSDVADGAAVQLRRRASVGSLSQPGSARAVRDRGRRSRHRAGAACSRLHRGAVGGEDLRQGAADLPARAVDLRLEGGAVSSSTAVPSASISSPHSGQPIPSERWSRNSLQTGHSRLTRREGWRSAPGRASGAAGDVPIVVTAFGTLRSPCRGRRRARRRSARTTRSRAGGGCARSRGRSA